MNTKITARHFELTDEIKSLANENFDGLSRYFDSIISSHLILNVEKHRQNAELQIKVYGQTLRASEESDDMYVSIESVFDKARGQLKKYKGKLKLKKPNKITSIADEKTKPETDVDAVDF